MRSRGIRPQSAYIISQGVSLANTTAGFNQSVCGVLGFGFGTIILAPWLLKMFKPSWLWSVPNQPNLKLPKFYILLGLLFYFFLTPILNRIPSISALASSGFALLSVGLCLACWKALCLHNNKDLIRWLALSCCIPLMTILNAGFISFGTTAAVPILIFVFHFYRPRWQVIIIALLALVLGLTVFVNYLRDREELRARIWGGQNFESRIEQLQQTVTTFEFFNPSKQEHLELIDTRLNQNVLVGRAVNYISSGIVDFADGESIVGAAIAVVPRIFWPGKPVSAGSGDIVSRYTGLEFPPGTSVGVGQVLEFYINFGTLGVILGYVVFSTVLRVIDITAGHKLMCGNWAGFASWFLPGLGLMQPGGSLTEVVSTVAASVVLMYLINRFYLKRKGQL
jgi:hypothetical protein